MVEGKENSNRKKIVGISKTCRSIKPNNNNNSINTITTANERPENKTLLVEFNFLKIDVKELLNYSITPI